MAITRTPWKVTLNSVNVTLSNLPAALTEFAGNVHRRARLDLTDCDRVRLTARVSTAANAVAVLKAQYSTDESVWNDLDGGLSLAAAGTIGGTWGNVPAGAKGDVVVRLVTQSGDGTADPVVGTVVLEVR